MMESISQCNDCNACGFGCRTGTTLPATILITRLQTSTRIAAAATSTTQSREQSTSTTNISTTSTSVPSQTPTSHHQNGELNKDAQIMAAVAGSIAAVIMIMLLAYLVGKWRGSRVRSKLVSSTTSISSSGAFDKAELEAGREHREELEACKNEIVELTSSTNEIMEVQSNHQNGQAIKLGGQPAAELQETEVMLPELDGGVESGCQSTGAGNLYRH